MNLHQTPSLESTDPEMFFKLFWLSNHFPSFWKTKRREKEKKRNIHNKFSSRSVSSGLFFFVVSLLFFLIFWISFSSHTSIAEQVIKKHRSTTVLHLLSLSFTQPPHPLHTLSAVRLWRSKVKTWLRRRGCGDRCSARSLRSPFWCGKPGRTQAAEAQNVNEWTKHIIFAYLCPAGGDFSLYFIYLRRTAVVAAGKSSTLSTPKQLSQTYQMADVIGKQMLKLLNWNFNCLFMAASVYRSACAVLSGRRNIICEQTIPGVVSPILYLIIFFTTTPMSLCSCCHGYGASQSHDWCWP